MQPTSVETYHPPTPAPSPSREKRGNLDLTPSGEVKPLVCEYPERVASAPTSPEQRERPRGAYPSVVSKFERYESFSGTAGDAGTDALIGTFSGRPDNIDLINPTAVDMLFTLQDRTGREESTIRVIAASRYETKISRERVMCQRATGNGALTVSVTGKWAEPREEREA